VDELKKAMLAIVAQISKSAVWPNSIRRGVRNSETSAVFNAMRIANPRCGGLETRATFKCVSPGRLCRTLGKSIDEIVSL
jgi:hypothetical protein